MTVEHDVENETGQNAKYSSNYVMYLYGIRSSYSLVISHFPVMITSLNIVVWYTISKSYFSNHLDRVNY